MQFNRTCIARFQLQRCRLTLREGLEEFYEINKAIFSPPSPDTPWTKLLVSHDIGHVFFGVNTSILDEAAGDCWTLCATNLSVKEYLAYARSPEGKKLIADIGIINIIKSLIFGFPLFCKIFWRSKKMNRQWKVKDYQQYMDVPLGELRADFNLLILDYP